MPTNDKAFRIDHIDAMYRTIDYVAECHIPRDMKLAALYGARMFAIHGGLPDRVMAPLDTAITYYERNRSILSNFVISRIGAGVQRDTETDDSGSGRGD